NPKFFVPVYEAQYRYARMLLNEQQGRPLTGEPSQREKNTVVTFAEKKLGFHVASEATAYEQARQLIRDEILRGSSEMAAALREAPANIKYYAMQSLMGDQPQLKLNDAAQGMALVQFLGKIGLDQEVGVTVSTWNSNPEYHFVLGSWDH